MSAVIITDVLHKCMLPNVSKRPHYLESITAKWECGLCGSTWQTVDDEFVDWRWMRLTKGSTQWRGDVCAELTDKIYKEKNA